MDHILDRGGTAARALATARPAGAPKRGAHADEAWARVFERACRHLDAPILRREDRRALRRIGRRLRRRLAYRLACPRDAEG